jgi:hypothetical protein
MLHVAPFAAWTHPGDPALNPASSVRLGEQWAHPPSGTISTSSEALLTET